MSTPTHTPRPWTLLLHERGGPIICGPVVPKTCGFQEILWSDDDYKRIVRSVNVAPKLAEALREGTGHDRDVAAMRELSRRFADNAPIVGADKEAAAEIIAEYARFIRVARAALAEWNAQ